MGDQLRQVADERGAGAFRSLCLTFWPKVRAMLMRQGADGKTAEDLAQETLQAVWCKAQQSSANGDVSALVYVNARNLRIDRLRRQAVWQSYCDEFAAAEPSRNVEGAIATCQQRRDEMHQALEKLPSEELEIIRLSFVEGLSQAEIAAKLALPLGTVNVRTRQAFHKLRRAMEGRS